MEEEKPKEQVVTGMVQMVNRRAESCGFNGKLMNRHMKTVLKFRNRYQGVSFIQVTTMKDDLQPKFDVNTISKIRNNFLSQGMVTIEANDTIIMVKDADPEKLESFIAAINLAKSNWLSKKSETDKQVEVTAGDPPDPTSSTSTSSPPTVPCSSNNKQNMPKVPPPTLAIKPSTSGSSTSSPRAKLNPKAAPLRQSMLNFVKISEDNQRENMRRMNLKKRVRSPSPTGFAKGEKAQLARIIKSSPNFSTVVKIDSKLAYLGAISPAATKLNINGINLKKIDDRVLVLMNLKHLDLCNNSLTNVDVLRQMNSTLETLKLSENKITVLDSRLRFAWRNLAALDLRKNLIQMLPESFVFLTRLEFLDVSHNALKCLPFNLFLLVNLKTLLVNDNQLTFFPDHTSHSLLKLDISHNHQDLHSPKVDQRRRHGFGSSWTEGFTLLETCGEAFLNGKFGRPELCHYNWPMGTVPELVMEYLYRAKRCNRCRKMVLRYSYVDKMGFGRDSAQEVVSDGLSICLRSVVCPLHL